MENKERLSMTEYCRLFEHMILAEYDNLFHNAELREDLGLDADTTGRFAVEYLSAALYLLDDLVPDCPLPEELARSVTAQVRAEVFRRILPDGTPEGTEAPYILYALKRAAGFADIYRRDDATMKLLVESCLDQAGLNDPVARMPQSVYLMRLLPGLVQLYCDLLCSVQAEEGESVRFRIILPA